MNFIFYYLDDYLKLKKIINKYINYIIEDQLDCEKN